MKNIIVSPYSRPLRNNQPNPKNYPYWNEVIKELIERDIYIIQVGVDGEEKIEEVNEYQFNLSLKELEKLILNVDTFISVDNFFHHLCWLLNKSGVVIFSQSDPLIFGHKNNINLLKDRKYLRPNQFEIWEQCNYNIESFIESQKVINSTIKLLSF